MFKIHNDLTPTQSLLVISCEDIIHLMTNPEGNSWFCFPETPDVSRDGVEGNIRTRGKIKPTDSRGISH